MIKTRRPLAKLAERVRTDGAAAALAHLRIVILHRAHASWDKRFRDASQFDQTAAKVELKELSINSANRAAGVHYLPTPWRVLDWLHEALPKATSDWSFVDLGAGKGRVVLSAGRHPYGRVVGVEFGAELAQAAREMIAASDGLAAKSIEVVEGDAAQFQFPSTPTIVFMYNPFGPPVINDVAAAIARSYAETPRPILIAYLNPKHGHLFEALKDFHEIKLSRRLATKFRVLSPHQIRIFASPEAQAR